MSEHFQSPIDSQILAAIQPWKKIIDAKGMRTVGETKVTLQQVRCGVQECNLGNFIADALVHYYVTSLSGKNEPWDDSIIALVPFGSMRATLNAGRTYIRFMPFLNVQSICKLLPECIYIY